MHMDRSSGDFPAAVRIKTRPALGSCQQPEDYAVTRHGAQHFLSLPLLEDRPVTPARTLVT